MPDDVTHWIALSHLPGIGPVVFRRLCDRFGDPENVFHAPAAEVARAAGLRGATEDALRRPAQSLEAARETAAALARGGFAVVTFRDANYPAPLRELRNPPPLLYTLGQLPTEQDRAFSIAGSTHPSRRGAEIAHAAGRTLAEEGWAVVSGYAEGVDAAAHIGALEGGGRTVFVLPMGVLAFHLRSEFERFRGEVGNRIVLVSECLPGAGWSSRGAVLRDRLIAALGRALLVVEARPSSGTMITFCDARRLGRPAYVVQYRHAPPGATGNRLAIREGGIPVDSLRALRAVARSRELPAAAQRTEQGELF